MWVFVALAGPPALFWPILLGMKRRRLADLWPALPLLFPYYLLIAAAAWTALYDLATRPHHWFKTEHGFARNSRRDAMAFARKSAQGAEWNQRAVMGDPRSDLERVQNRYSRSDYADYGTD